MSEQVEIPNNWKSVKLGKYVISVKGKKPKRISNVKTKECPLPYVNIKAFEKNKIDEYTDGVGCVICEDGDFLMVWDGSRSGYVGKGIKGALGSTLVKLDFPDIENNYAYYFLQSKFLDLNTRAKGVGIPHVDPNILWNYDLLIPPKPTQQAIVSKIEELFSELDNGIAQLKTAQQQLNTYRQAVLKWAFEGRLTNKDVKDGELPEGWKWVKLGEVAEVKRGKSKHRPRNDKRLFGNTVPFIQTGEIREANGGTVRHYSQMYSEFGLAQSKLWPKGTLCLTIAANIAETAFLGFDCCFPDSVVGINSDPEKLSLFYVNYIIQKLKKEIDAKASATAQKNINVEFLENLEVPYCTIEEQLQIVDEIERRLSVADKLQETIDTALAQSESLRQSILKQAFEGRLVREAIKQKDVKPYKPKNIVFYQAQILSLINEYSKEKDIKHGEMTIAKYAYLIDRLFDIPTFYNYQRLHLGPFPKEINKVIKNKKFFKKTNGVLETVNPEGILKYNNPYKHSLEIALEELIFMFLNSSAEKRSHETELLATVCKAIEDTEVTDLPTIRQSMKDWPIDLATSQYKNKAEKFTEEETRKCIGFIVSKGWDKKLIQNHD